MREIRPLILPDLVASQHQQNTAPCTPEEFTMSSSQSTHTSSNSTDSLPYGASDCSSPVTPSFSRHIPASGSTSSLSSTPPTYDSLESLTSSTGKLPDLVEEPAEPDHGLVVVDHDTALSPCLCDVEVCVHQVNPFVRGHDLHSSIDYDMCFSDDGEFLSQQLAKRRKSGDSTSGFTARLGNRFPSLSRKLGDRRRTTSTSRSRSSSQPRSSRASSVTRGTFVEQPETPAPQPSTSLLSEEPEEITSTPIEIILPERIDVEEPIDRIALTSTPLLPPLMVDLRANKDSPMQSPLQSPTIASPNPFSVTNSPMAGTPQILPSPPLSTKPSISSFHRSGHTIPPLEIPPLPVQDVDDEWAIKLGHANFTILPEPYMPEHCDAESCQQLFSDWETARCNFVRHQVRTGEHYGITSKTYKLTEEKWSEIDQLWKKYHDAIVAIALPRGHLDFGTSSVAVTQPTPFAVLPTIHSINNNSKFPKLGDEEIVGPMVQIASKLQYKQSRKASLLRLFEDMRFPSSFLSGRGSTSVRG